MSEGNKGGASFKISRSGWKRFSFAQFPHPYIPIYIVAMSSSSKLVLITGGSSFVGLHAIHQAIQQSYRVRTTIRSESKKELILTALKEYDGSLSYDKLEFVHADLLKDEGWNEAAGGVDFVLHIASPFPGSDPKDENDLIIPARDGTLRVLKAAKGSSTCKRVVVTSSVAAVAYGTKEPSGGGSANYTEKDWTNVNGPGVSAYVKSKTLAEEAAWKYVREGEGKGSLELSVVNPVGIFGPPIRAQDDSTTCNIIKDMLNGKFPLVPKIGFGIVDVRDVASLLLLAMTKAEANGERYICNGDTRIRTLLEVSLAIREKLPNKATKAPTKEMPDWLVRVGSYVMAPLKLAASQLGKTHGISNEKAVALGWKPRTPEEAVVATAQRFYDTGILH